MSSTVSSFELLAAPHTPFRSDGSLALDVVARQSEHLRRSGVDGVFVAGSTGEGASLTGEERRRLVERWVEVGSGLKIWVHVGHNSVAEARGLAEHAAGLPVAGISAAPPSWFGIDTVDRLVETCAAVASAAPQLPFLYYHIPVLSHVSLPMVEFARAARQRVPTFGGIKYTHLDAVDFQACVREHGTAIRLYWGCDELLVTGLALGAHGAVGSTYNFAAPHYRRLIAAFRDGNMAIAQQLQSQAAALVERLAQHGYMAAAKAAMLRLGIDVGTTRLPLRALDSAGEASVSRMLDEFGFDGMCT